MIFEIIAIIGGGLLFLLGVLFYVLYRYQFNKTKEFETLYQNSQDERASIDALLSERNTECEKLREKTKKYFKESVDWKANYDNLMKKYKDLFCEEPGCNSLKYFKFKYCTVHVKPQTNNLDEKAMNGERPVNSGELPLENHDLT
jgi:hypothetical protein